MSKLRIRPKCKRDFETNKVLRAEAQRAKIAKTSSGKKDENITTSKSLHKLLV